ncbi:hypothetical protein A3K34_04875 [candidate division WWE3 bacterium RIFOXYC1_FULL_40_10]|uniref:Uncharacterized protein n=1 Tax=candidate division WWE3 bacterium RIFOXYA2_FULL_46_9 TaxID=1802636 RepID=A0A1F4W191_UNCKA|nr:MAG: hypothetical protein A3K58_04875 [candidate division WWE3 bacterium RIFOXYB1_FULL_40_22]OGC62171.1 MAG: hypothetical protein A3K37_04875 [candidate division WWE3 bacterium RIFOXYA1_FULL_40_11]OGC63184.1 MAG: hypothetical protein A2264_00630 [candidate division WWE3 bacterium RIFOXYA2_FULL_46_9]OGC65265.1 MAG: hypothetical protein A2326_04260 [candidate division WWE3 bacterium RIFOXYB2_FULL_41_6]OGC66554.1 MAG: hypothetical protein A3K34_04875 [candidate division WWE3 bacterium RIFOXYC1_
MAEEIVVVLKAYRSYLEREAGAEPLETKEVKTPAKFDEATQDFYSRGFYVAYFGKSGVQLKSMTAARYLLSNPN